ncbi:MAG: septum site-determining protein MinC [Christensenellales bacterium]|jgi:septum site-determining protein MinC
MTDDRAVVWRGTKKGACIYVQKPLPKEALAARIAAMLSAMPGALEGTLFIGGLCGAAQATVSHVRQALALWYPDLTVELLPPQPTENAVLAPCDAHLKERIAPVIIWGNVRGGQQVKSPGDVIVVGSVHPGARVIAGGHVVVLGSLKGFVHAGALGDSEAKIAAGSMAPQQLRIARRMIGRCGEMNAMSRALIKGEKIVVERLHRPFKLVSRNLRKDGGL